MIAIEWEAASRPILWHERFDDGLFIGDRALIEEPFAVTIERQTRAWIAGDNGAGKTTLMHHIMVRIPLDPERVLWLGQQTGERDVALLRGDLRELPPDELGHVMQIVAALGTNPEQVLHEAVWSPGVCRKVALALGLARRVWLIALDEPTNHLDLPSIERLERALGAYGGALLMITHDVALARACCNEIWRIDAQRQWRIEAIVHES